jgi:hypothetical protein
MLESTQLAQGQSQPSMREVADLCNDLCNCSRPITQTYDPAHTGCWGSFGFNSSVHEAYSFLQETLYFQAQQAYVVSSIYLLDHVTQVFKLAFLDHPSRPKCIGP